MISKRIQVLQTVLETNTASTSLETDEDVGEECDNVISH